jgi:AhpD family alkylhydroperoxidase
MSAEPISAEPRIAPGGKAEIGPVNSLIARVIGRAMGTGPPNIFTTLARHRRLFRPWLRFAGRLMPRGTLPRSDTELLILRTAHNCDCSYEWSHHERLGKRAGLSAEEIAAVARQQSNHFSERQQLLLAAADELHGERSLSDELWARLRPILSDAELIELCMLVGHYEMLAMTLNTLRVQPER